MLNELICKKITEVLETDLEKCSNIMGMIFANCSNLKKIEIPYSVKEIGNNAFMNCTALSDIDSVRMNPCCYIGNKVFDTTKWYTNQTADLITIANGGIIVGNNITTPSTDLIIPGEVKSIGGYGLKKVEDDSDFTSVDIPDTVEILGGYVFSDHNYLKKIVVGAGVKRMGSNLTPDTTVTTLVFRQPTDMIIDLPAAGDGTGIAYNKSSRAISIYTDNECIKNYDWATDNVTATFYPLSEAPE